VHVDAVLPGDAMCACGRGVLAVLVVLLSHLLELVLAVAVLGVLVLFAFPRRSVLAQVLQLAQDALGVGATSLDVLEDDRLDLLAHGEQLGARGYRGRAAAAF
jgi:hypothetical protein